MTYFVFFLIVLCVFFKGLETSPTHCHDYDWRYTFASSESDLFHYHRDKRALKLAYVTLKYLIKRASKEKTRQIGTLSWYLEVIHVI